jgi:hypothetical protein
MRKLDFDTPSSNTLRLKDPLDCQDTEFEREMKNHERALPCFTLSLGSCVFWLYGSFDNKAALLL